VRESAIKHEAGPYWVCENKSDYTVYVSGITHSKPDSSYAKDDDGLSLAIARCDYLARSKASASGKPGGYLQRPLHS